MAQFYKKNLCNGKAFLATAFGLSGFAATAQAQESDSTLVREMLIEKEYTPVVRDADKIVRMPEVESPKANKTAIVHSDPAFSMSPGSEINNLSSGNIGTNYKFSRERGYLNIGYGVYNNIVFDKGFKFVDTDENKFGIILNLNSFSGRVKSNQSSDKSRMRNTNSVIDLFYNHTGSKVKFSSDIKLGWNPFSYYGFVPETIDGTQLYDTEQSQEAAPWEHSSIHHLGQRISRFGADFKIESNNNPDWYYEVFASFMRLGFKRPDFSENAVHMGGQLSRIVSDSWRLTGDVDLKYLIYAGDKYGLKNSGVSSFKAYFDYLNKDEFSFKGGLVLDVANGLSPHFTVAPNVDLDWKVSEAFGMYTSFTGGMKQYSFDDEITKIRYFLGDQTKNSYTPVDFNIGFRTSPVSGLQFDVFANLDYTCNERFYYSNLSAYYKPLESEEFSYALNRIGAYTKDAFKYSVGGIVKYNYGKTFDIKFAVQGNGYSLKDEYFASYKPKCEIKLNLGYRPVEKLLLNLDYDFQSRNDGLVEKNVSYFMAGEEISALPDAGSSLPSDYYRVSMKNLNMMNVKATYSFTDTFALYAHVNNITNYKHDQWYGMPTMGLNFIAGFSFKY